MQESNGCCSFIPRKRNMKRCWRMPNKNVTKKQKLWVISFDTSLPFTFLLLLLLLLLLLFCLFFFCTKDIIGQKENNKYQEWIVFWAWVWLTIQVQGCFMAFTVATMIHLCVMHHSFSRASFVFSRIWFSPPRLTPSNLFHATRWWITTKQLEVYGLKSCQKKTVLFPNKIR